VSIVVVGLNHKTAPVGLLERLAIPPDALVKSLHQLAGYDHVLEGIVLSTCNRVEAYANVTKFHGGIQDLRNFLSETRHVAPEEFSDHIYTYHDEAAVAHLCRVAAGLDSMVVGESEILGQVRGALQAASDEGLVQRTLRRAFSQALRVGKRVRTETSIGRHPVSVSSAAVELARRVWPTGSLAGKRVLIVGAGKMGGLAMRALVKAGAGETTIVNRSEERAQGLAAAYGAASKPFEQLADELARSDIVICSTTAPGVVLDVHAVQRAARRRTPSDPLVIVDIAMPRDVDPSVAGIPNVVLRDIDDLSEVVEGRMSGRLAEVSKVEAIVAEEVARFAQWEAAIELGPTVARLVERSEAVRRSEIDRVEVQLAELPRHQRELVEQLTRRLIGKLLHAPLSRSRELANSTRGLLYREALHELFELDDDLEP
jgi:glutamyl-tRNA reductase